MFWSRAAQALAPRVGIWNFDIVCHLSIVIWDFSAIYLKANCFYLNQLELTLTNRCLRLGVFLGIHKKVLHLF